MEASITSLKNLSQQPLAVDFIDNQLQYYHPAFKNRSVSFHPVAKRYLPAYQMTMANKTPSGNQQNAPAAPVPRPVTAKVDSMSFWDGIFPDAMRKLKEDYPVEPRGREKHGYSMRKQNWSEVSAQLQKARDSYEGRTGRLEFIKSGARRILNTIQGPIQQGIKLVPEMDIVSPVLGAVEILLDAVKQAADVRDTVSERLDRLEQNFEAIEVYTTIYRDDQNIRNASVNLVATILKAVEDVIGYFTRNILVKAGIAVFTGEQYQKRLKGSLKSIETDSQSLLEQAQFSQSHMIRLIWLNTTKSRREQEAEASFKTNVLSLLQEKEKTNQDLMRKNSQLQYQNGLLQGQVQALSRPVSPSPSASPEEPFVSQEDLLVLLDVPDIHQQDLVQILWNKDLISTRDQERAEQLLSQRGFRQWVVTSESARLLVHGDFDRGGELQDISALSVFTAMFVQVMRNAGGAPAPGTTPTRQNYSIFFFCGLHSRIFHDFVGPEWMIRSLVAQLLCQDIVFDTIGLDYDVNLFSIESSNDVHALCSLFVWLVRQMPPQATLFCFVDGIIFFERPDYADAMGYVLRELLDLVDDEYVQCKIKVLVTSAIDTRIVRGYHAFVDGDNTLSTNSLRGSSGLNSRIERQLDDALHGAIGYQEEVEGWY